MSYKNIQIFEIGPIYNQENILSMLISSQKIQIFSNQKT